MRVQSVGAQVAAQATAAQAAVGGYMAGATTLAPAAYVATTVPLYAPTYTTPLPVVPGAPARLFEVSDGAAVSHGSATTVAFLAVSAAFLLGTSAVAIAIRRVRAPETNYDEEQLVLAEEGLE